MALRPTLEEQELLADTKRRADEPLVSREIACELVTAVAFVAAVVILWLAYPPTWFAPAPAALSFLVFAIAARVSFETPLGFTVATQLGFVPLLFALPVATVPLVVAAALVLERLPQILTGKVSAERLFGAVGNAWFAIGPVAVFVIAGTHPGDADAALLVAALAAQIAVDFVVSGARGWISRGATLAQQLQDWWVYGIDIALAVVGLTVAEEVRQLPIAALAPLPLLALLAVFARERAERIDSLLELSTAYRGTALVLGDVIEADDGYTGEHCKSVVRLAIDVAGRLGLTAEERRNVEFAALLHDIGKIAIPKDIINKPGRLTEDEWKVIETHTVEGQKMLDRIGGFMQHVGAIVRSHHERWDGGGYPDGLAGDTIPVAARIITACDSWNAMRTDRSYRKALPYEHARGEMLRHAGAQFDPQIVDVLLDLVEETEGSAARSATLTASAGSTNPALTRAAGAPNPA